jgi:hypothetical protein
MQSGWHAGCWWRGACSCRWLLEAIWGTLKCLLASWNACLIVAQQGCCWDGGEGGLQLAAWLFMPLLDKLVISRRSLDLMVSLQCLQ